MTAVEGWVPEFEGQRPPFERGNTVSVQHGAHSARVVDPIARELVDGLLADPECVYLAAPRYRSEVLAWGRAEAQAQVVSEYLAKRAAEAGDGVGDLDAARVRSAYQELHRAETRAASARTRLGLTPLAAARLGRDRAAATADMAQVMAALAKAAEQEASS